MLLKYVLNGMQPNNTFDDLIFEGRLRRESADGSIERRFMGHHRRDVNFPARNQVDRSWVN